MNIIVLCKLRYERYGNGTQGTDSPSHPYWETKISYAVSPSLYRPDMCSCIAGAISKQTALSVEQNNASAVDLCLVCLRRAATNESGVMKSANYALESAASLPVKGCPNKAIVYEERGEAL